MREILYRGLHRRKGEKVRLDGTPVESKWVYGGVCQYNAERAIIYQTEPEIAKFPVYAETVGQFTGLTDKNGKKIFEGDIVKNHKKDTGVIQWFEEHSAFMIFCTNQNKVYFLYDNDFSKIEVIGNIHDNPELLGGERNATD